MKNVLTLTAILFAVAAFSAPECDNSGVCAIPASADGEESVLSPIGRSFTRPITQAPRLSSLKGKILPWSAEYPGAFSAHTREELLKNTGKILYPQIIHALTAAVPQSA